MPKRDKIVYLNDMLSCCEELQQLYVDAGDFKNFSANNYFVRTAERCFQILGEALHHVDNYDPNIAINSKQQIIYIPVVNDRNEVTYRNLIYQLKGNYFEFIGIEKRKTE